MRHVLYELQWTRRASLVLLRLLLLLYCCIWVLGGGWGGIKHNNCETGVYAGCRRRRGLTF